jgi:hypothetical protein
MSCFNRLDFIYLPDMLLKKHRFRIISYNKGDSVCYETRVKTWIGWVAFTVFYKTEIIHVLSDPLAQKKLAYDRIFQYCQEKGYLKNDVEIYEIDNSKNKWWNLFH